jgi:phospholipid/cholesterol/gamma-HCH transport system substrate-binding protein
MINKTRYTLVGLFVLVLGGAFIAGVLWLGAGGLETKRRLYQVYMAESVAGLSRDGAVKYRGVDVGRVKTIELAPDNPERVRLLLEIDAETPVKQDTVATLEVQGLTGLGFVNLLGGSRDAPPLALQGSEEYPVIPSVPSVWGRLDRSLGELVDNLAVASERLRTLLDPANQALIVDTLRDVGRVSAALAERSGSLEAALEDLAATMHHAREASSNLPDLMARVQASASALENMANEVALAGGQLRAVTEARDDELQRFTGAVLPEAAVMVQELRLAAEKLRHLSESVERDPGILLRGAPAPLPGPGE